MRLSARLVCITLVLGLLTYPIPARSEAGDYACFSDDVGTLSIWYGDDWAYLYYTSAEMNYEANWSRDYGYNFNDPYDGSGSALAPYDVCNDSDACKTCIMNQREICRQVLEANRNLIKWSMAGAIAACATTAQSHPIFTYACILIASKIAQAAYGVAKTQFNQCWAQAPSNCTDPVTGQTCTGLIYNHQR